MWSISCWLPLLPRIFPGTHLMVGQPENPDHFWLFRHLWLPISSFEFIYGDSWNWVHSSSKLWSHLWTAERKYVLLGIVKPAWFHCVKYQPIFDKTQTMDRVLLWGNLLDGIEKLFWFHCLMKCLPMFIETHTLDRELLWGKMLNGIEKHSLVSLCEM